MARNPNNGPSMSGIRPRYSFNGGSSGGSGMSMSMLDSMFPDSLWKYGTLSELVEEVNEFEIEPSPRKKRKTRRKSIKRKSNKSRIRIKQRTRQKPVKRRRRSTTKLIKKQPERPSPKFPTVAVFLQSQRVLKLQRQRQLEMAIKMKSRAMVKARQVRLEKLLSEIPASAIGKFYRIKSRVTKKQRKGLVIKGLKEEMRKWQKRIDEVRLKEATYRDELKKVRAANVVRAAPPPKHLQLQAIHKRAGILRVR